MADLKSCYFCGEGPHEALGEHGVVPAAFEPTDEQQRSVVLCPSCRDKLTAVMRAAVAAAGDRTGGAGTATAGERTPDRDDDAATTGDGADDLADAGGLGTGGGDGAADDAGASTAGDPAGATGSGDRESASAGGLAPDPSGDAGGDDPSDDEAAEAPSGGDPDDSTGADAAAGTDTDAGAAAAAEEEDDIARTQGDGVSFNTAAAGDEQDEVAGGDGGDEAPPQRETGAASVDGDGEDLLGNDSEAYRQVIRLLQNREFPVRRDEIAEVAASAYELSPQETQSAIDAVVQKGLLTEEDGVLRKT